jgi:hypothetical protein
MILAMDWLCGQKGVSRIAHTRTGHKLRKPQIIKSTSEGGDV